MHVLEATVGGTRRHLLDLCLNLPPRFRQHLVCSTLRDEGFNSDITRLRAAGIEVTVLPMVREISPPRDWQCLRALRRLVRDWQPDIVHGHSAKGGFLARLVQGSPPYAVYSPHGFPFQMRTSGLKHALYVALERWAGRRTDRLIVVSEGGQQLALDNRLVPPDRLVTIPNGVRAEEFEIEIDREAYRLDLGLPEGVQVVGTLAALVPQKGLDRLLHAAAAIYEQRGAATPHFVIAGDGPLRAELEALSGSLGLSDLVHFLGRRTDIPELLQVLEVFVLPSLWEGLPYAILEAGAAGLPVVVSDIPGNRDVVKHGVTGRLARDDFAAQIAAMLDDEPAARAQGRRLRDLIQREYTLAHMVEGHVSLYSQLVGR
ncbi:MAG: glycosyltransferase family 4 protein [Armatimonadia bacterium]